MAKIQTLNAISLLLLELFITFLLLGFPDKLGLHFRYGSVGLACKLDYFMLRSRAFAKNISDPTGSNGILPAFLNYFLQFNMCKFNMLFLSKYLFLTSTPGHHLVP